MSELIADDMVEQQQPHAAANGVIHMDSILSTEGNATQFNSSQLRAQIQGTLRTPTGRRPRGPRREIIKQRLRPSKLPGTEKITNRDGDVYFVVETWINWVETNSNNPAITFGQFFWENQPAFAQRWPGLAPRTLRGKVSAVWYKLGDDCYGIAERSEHEAA